jgi:hypothetical protein
MISGTPGDEQLRVEKRTELPHASGCEIQQNAVSPIAIHISVGAWRAAAASRNAR